MVEPAVTRLMSGTEKGRKRPEPSKTAKIAKGLQQGSTRAVPGKLLDLRDQDNWGLHW